MNRICTQFVRVTRAAVCHAHGTSGPGSAGSEPRAPGPPGNSSESGVGATRRTALEGGPAASPDAPGVESVRVAGASSLAAGRGGGAGHAAVAAVAGVVRGDAGLGRRPWLADFGRLLNKMSGPRAPGFGFSDAPSGCAHCLSGGHCAQRVCPPVHCLSVSAGRNWSRGSPSLTCPGASDDANSRGRRRACILLGGQGAVDRGLSPPLVIVFR